MLRAYTSAGYGDPTAQPVLPDVPEALAALHTAPPAPSFAPVSAASYGFWFKPEVRVSLLGHLQGLARLSGPGNHSWFVFTKHHQRVPRQAGLLFVRWPRLGGSGEALVHEAPAGGPGQGVLQKGIFGRSLHPGGAQLCGALFAVAHSTPSEPSWIEFVDVQDPTRPFTRARLTLDKKVLAQPPGHITCVALSRAHDGKYLCFVYSYSSGTAGIHKGWLFVTNTAFLNANSSWAQLAYFDRHSFPAEWREDYQNIAFLGQADGQLFLACTRGFQTDNQLELFALEENPVALRYRARKFVRTRAGGATFRAGASLYITPSNQLVLYACQKEGGGQVRKLLVEEFSVL